MTDITELAQRARINAECGEHLSPAETMELVEALEKAQRYIERLREWNAGLAQESCERQQLISELEPIRATAEKLVHCKGRYHSEQNYRSLAALFGVTTPDLPPLEHESVHYADAAEMEIAALRQRIAELESSGIASGILRCTECSFVQTKNIISISPDAIVIGNSKPEPCPNGCGSLQPVTWKALAIQLMFTTKQGVSELLEAKKRISELESFRTAYMEWGDKTDWVQGDKRFDVLIPWGKHRADVLKAYIERLESRTVTVKLPDYRNTYKSPFADEVEHQVRLALELFSSASGIKVEVE
ncbi:ead/Ea22-like family protein [Klebsiella quasipneumoniae]|uniref:ead/Ea22-like family protein n=1 Tax=Klebsiella quasipneumoniae TaxID=1463165 RepID=UPI0032EF0054